MAKRELKRRYGGNAVASILLFLLIVYLLIFLDIKSKILLGALIGGAGGAAVSAGLSLAAFVRIRREHGFAHSWKTYIERNAEIEALSPLQRLRRVCFSILAVSGIVAWLTHEFILEFNNSDRPIYVTGIVIFSAVLLVVVWAAHIIHRFKAPSIKELREFLKPENESEEQR